MMYVLDEREGRDVGVKDGKGGKNIERTDMLKKAVPMIQCACIK